MAVNEPLTELDQAFSGDGASPTLWSEAQERLAQAEIFWLSTVRPHGRPHVTPLIAVWLDGALHFCTVATERKAKNIAHNPKCILTTGTNAYDEALDLVVEGEAVRIADDVRLGRLADAWVAKYGPDWRFTVQDGMFRHSGGDALVFEVAPQIAFGFGKGETFSQTRWRFS